MSKELTPLEALKNVIKYCEYKYCDEELYIIENALNKLEGLEMVYKVAKDYEEELIKDRDYWRNEAYKKQLKALEIIKKIIKYDVEVNGDNTIPEYHPNDVFTQDEYDLLKEVLL